MEKLGADAFDGERLRREGTWIVAFLADWCPFCRRFQSPYERLAPDDGFRVAVGDVTSEESRLWDVFRIEVVPTLVVFRDGQAVFRADGILGEGLPAEAIDQARAAALAHRR